MQCIVRTTLSHDVRLSVCHTTSVCPSVTHDVRLSVRHTRCPSVTRRYCVIVLSSSGSHTIRVVPHSTLWQYSDGDPLTVSSSAGGMKKSWFFISKMIQDRDIATIERNFANRKPYRRVRMVPFSVIWVTCNPHFKVTWLLDAKYLRYGHIYNEILTGTYTRPTQGCYFEWPWVT